MKVQLVACLISLHLCHSFLAVSSCQQNEREALLSFKSQLSDPSKRLSSWEGKNCCNWKGIVCSKFLRVISIDLRNPTPNSFLVNQNDELVPVSKNSSSTVLKGTLSPSIFSLSELVYLDLSYNDFLLSDIPEGPFSNLSKLTYLNLSNSNFRGSINNQFMNLTSLISLDLSCAIHVTDSSSITLNVSSDLMMKADSLYSYISGGALSSLDLNWLRPLRKLRKLVLRGVDLSEASLSSSSSSWAEPLSSLSLLETLELSNCSIFGKLPADGFLNLTRLTYLLMDFNHLASPIPIQFRNLTSLSTLDFTNSDVRGSLPHLPQLSELIVGSNSNLAVDLQMVFSLSWPRLKVLDIHSTQVLSSIPVSISNTSSLIDLIAYNCLIQGPLPHSIANLSKLEGLYFSFNNLTGEIPPILGMRNLSQLSLLQNSLGGPIPDSLCSLSSLRYLGLAGNSLTGTLPECIGDLPNLEYIHIGFNKMNGSISSLGSLSSNSTLAYVSLGFSGLSIRDKISVPKSFSPIVLDLGSCQLTGAIPEFISKLIELKMLMLGYNNLSGTIPDWLFNLPNLGYLDLSYNNLEGVLPASIELKKFFGATSLLISNNYLQGTIPVMGPSMDLVDLSWNDFSGELPVRSKLGKLKVLGLSGNKLSGQIPLSWCETEDSLTALDLSSNGLWGPLPLSMASCKFLTFINLSSNKFDGRIPPDLFDEVRNLEFLGLANNLFDGILPRFIQSLKNLEVLQMESNRFQGPIPWFMGNLGSLKILTLGSNLLNGSIPEEMTSLKELQYLDLSSNNLSGPIPKKLSSMTALNCRHRNRNLLGFVIYSVVYVGVQLKMITKGKLHRIPVVREYITGIDLSSNTLNGSIPFEIGFLQVLFMLNLSHNFLSGPIHQSIGNMSSLESLNLSFNQLGQEIPKTITLLDFLSMLNLSYNNLTGKIPSSPHFDTLSSNGSAYIGNKFLCGAPGGINCTDTPSDHDEDEVDDYGEEKIILCMFVITGYALGIIVPFMFLYLNKDWRRNYWRKIDCVVTRISNFFSSKGR
ncbi:hypothetical protein SAY87_014437 [Trapa incisa]|uniref:Leucine-rich repeat-containing N-terminal plant-type domain-containing protein n=1 Tax=Trapa incisa TaxID=236973 RepID=A0AAN7GJZ4_9MYRT|nr:hypothetical protein SAY87_014437 [Trapa incisa]